MDNDTYWSIEFLGVDSDKAEAIVKLAVSQGLATSAISADPGSFLTLHLDADTARSLDQVLASSGAEGDQLRTVDTLREAIEHWLSARSG